MDCNLFPSFRLSAKTGSSGVASAAVACCYRGNIRKEKKMTSKYTMDVDNYQDNLMDIDHALESEADIYQAMHELIRVEESLNSNDITF